MADSEGVKSAVILRSEEDFGGTPDFLSGSSSKRSKKKKKKKQAAGLKPLEKAVFKQAKRLDEASKIYKDRHEKSNRKKKNGWIKDFGKNYTKSMSKLMKF
ncbi:MULTISPECIES: hypothetical protein [Moorena]|uniref:Uncharacterized protein n=1 Tax=Moorena bouillonii PNG TaxID=568701 RepID=A0A1U7MW68_9CYAN|nr:MULTISPECIES: hypothetical protein [Moorena]NEO16441.1 hypothetical protein [Moorena sp. SIO3E8]NEO82326.1 hypothetical protein [Moorena sp. SIO4G3]NEP99027.1 hypothetical protein [Moorena sp. SIO3F7]NEQ63218.1 hypothetical protein [Moorena sp. SIO4A1]OLT57943.1 hypothetical protein BJP37_01675 [Moorena bouillonii PNG]